MDSTSGGTTCNAHTCTTKASGTTCNPIPSFDFKTYTICGPALVGGCAEVGGITLLASTCQEYSLNTFIWNETTSQCVACYTTPSEPIDPGTGGGTSTDEKILNSLAALVILTIIGWFM